MREVYYIDTLKPEERKGERGVYISKTLWDLFKERE